MSQQWAMRKLPGRRAHGPRVMCRPALEASCAALSVVFKPSHDGLLTVKLNGRAEAPDGRCGRTIFPSARGAQPLAHHGPFQRWLEDASISLLCARGFLSANPARGLPQSQTKGLCLGSSRLSLSLHRRVWLRPLTVKLSGRPTPPDKHRGRTLSSSARGAKPLTHHGPLQRLLAD